MDRANELPQFSKDFWYLVYATAPGTYETKTLHKPAVCYRVSFSGVLIKLFLDFRNVMRTNIKKINSINCIITYSYLSKYEYFLLNRYRNRLQD